MVFCFPCKVFRRNFDDEDSTSKAPLTEPKSQVEAPRTSPRVAIIIYSMYGHIAQSTSTTFSTSLFLY